MKCSKQTLLLLGYALAVGLVFLSSVPLLDPDEPVYGETAKEMLATGDFLSPRIYGEFWYDKPPLFYWQEALSFSLFGVSDFTARLPSVLIGAGTAVYLYHSARHIFPEKTAFLGAFLFASMLEPIVLARSAVTDMTLTAALTVALMSFLREKYAAAYIACGFALLAKGPIGFGFPALIVGLWLLVQGKFTLKPIMRLRWYWGIPLACLVGLPWYLYMTSVHGAAFVDTFLGYHNLTRFAAPEHAGKDHCYLYLIVLAAGCFPWSGAVFASVSRFVAWRRDPARLYLIVWAAFIFLFFSASATQLFSYILPLFPPLALLAAVYLEEEREKQGKLFPALHLLFLAATAAAISLAPLTPAGGSAAKYGLSAALLFLGGGALYFFRRGEPLKFYILQGTASLFLICAVWSLFAAPVAESFTSRHISARVLETARDPSRPLYIDPFYRPASAFYHDLYGRKLPDDVSSISGPAYILVQKHVCKDWPADLRETLEPLWETETALFLQIHSKGDRS